MALFGNLFEKKYCSVCGNEIKLLGNRKLADGNLCKECANKLSPWFSERRQSTVEEIKQQLEYREANKAQVEAFNVTRTLGNGTKVLLDEDNKKFIITSSSNFKSQNPDVLDYSQVTGCNIDIDESKSEVRKKLEDGKYESYVPAQYDYSYDIYLTVFVNNPYFNEIKFKINNFSIDIDNPYVSESHGVSVQASAQPAKQPVQGGAGAGMSQQARAQQMAQQRPGLNPQRAAQPQRPGAQTQRPGMRPETGMGRQPRLPEFIPDPQSNMEYVQAVTIANEIKEALTQVRETVREEAFQASQPKQAVTCPCCGATTIPDANGCCEYCGAALNN